jgi:hypothetical protein
LAASETNFSGDLHAPRPPGESRGQNGRGFLLGGLVRSGSRSDPFRGPGCAGCTEMHYSPGNLPEKGGWAAPPPPPPFTLASRSLLRSPGPGLSFRGTAQLEWSRTRAVTCVTAESRCSSWNSHPRHCITLAYFLITQLSAIPSHSAAIIGCYQV